LVEPVTSATLPLKSNRFMEVSLKIYDVSLAILNRCEGWRQMAGLSRISGATPEASNAQSA
jgi:hypothetical protein